MDKPSSLVVMDFEFGMDSNSLPLPKCMVAHELDTGTFHKTWLADGPVACPFDLANSTLVAFAATAELHCIKILGWPRPEAVIDLHPEFRVLTNETKWTIGHSDLTPVEIKNASLLTAGKYFDLAHAMSDQHKEAMRGLALRDGQDYSVAERLALLAYCTGDVDLTTRLLQAMEQGIDWPRALLRGRYLAALTQVEAAGIPIDMALLQAFRAHQASLKQHLISEVDSRYNVFRGGSFSRAAFREYLIRKGIDWPKLPSGELCLDEGTFKDMAAAYPELKELATLRKTLAQLRQEKLVVGADGRNRVSFRPFAAKTGRNAPSTTRFSLALSKPFRALVRPALGHALVYLDYQQQEYGIAASLSGDKAMADSYRSGDPYLHFAQQAGAVPLGATKESHPIERSRYKVTTLAVQYGMAEKSLARQLQCSEGEAKRLLADHKRVYKVFWQWSAAVEHRALEQGYISTNFGWRMHVDASTNPRSLLNWPMQAHGAEMLRIALILCVEAGIKVIAPVHDALLIEVPKDRLTDTTALAQRLMREASEIVLPGFSLRTDADIISDQDHFPVGDGAPLWHLIQQHLTQFDGETHHA
ncbi:DNA polymerase [Aeromonas rivipollensis]|uniref:DNA polymerase n=1 Tax=Aeromonas rivipollensis TaxID=948519 RepID=UPI003D1B4B56